MGLAEDRQREVGLQSGGLLVNMNDLAYVIPTDLHDRLINWARWACGGYSGYGSCASAEGRYIAEAGDIWLEERRAIPLPVDIRDAWRVEKTWRLLPRKERTVLHLHFIYGRSPNAIARAMKIRRNEFPAALYAAAVKLGNSLAKPQHFAA